MPPGPKLAQGNKEVAKGCPSCTAQLKGTCARDDAVTRKKPPKNKKSAETVPLIVINIV